jgi:hypothetical protein
MPSAAAAAAAFEPDCGNDGGDDCGEEDDDVARELQGFQGDSLDAPPPPPLCLPSTNTAGGFKAIMFQLLQ